VTVPRPVNTVLAVRREFLLRIATHPTQASNIPRITRVPSVATSKSGPTHDGASAIPSVTER